MVFLEVPIAIHNYTDQKPDAAREDVKNKEPVSLGLSNKALNVGKPRNKKGKKRSHCALFGDHV